MKNYKIGCGLLVLCFVFAYLRSNSQSETGYPFVVDSMNSIVIPNDTSARLSNFFDKMNLLLCGGEGQVSILHIGGSHVQADMFSHQVRSHLDTLLSDSHASRGLIFPYETAKTNNPHNYKVTHTGTWVASRNVRENRRAQLGLCGIAVTTDTIAEISVNLDSPEEIHRWTCNRITMIGYSDSPLVEPVILVGDTKYTSLYDSASSTYVYEIPDSTEKFTLSILQHDTIPHSFTVGGFLVENNHRGFVYHAVGVNGASVPSYLSCEHFERDLKLIHPDMVIFAIGINDAVSEQFSDSAFMAHYDSLIAKIEHVVPNCAYIFITNNDSFKRIKKGKKVYYVVNQNGLRVQHVFYELAKKHNGAVWDMFAIMGGLNSMRQWEAFGLAQKDKIHFTKKGYKLMGDMLYRALIDAYNNTMMSKQ